MRPLPPLHADVHLTGFFGLQSDRALLISGGGHMHTVGTQLIVFGRPCGTRQMGFERHIGTEFVQHAQRTADRRKRVGGRGGVTGRPFWVEGIAIDFDSFGTQPKTETSPWFFQLFNQVNRGLPCFGRRHEGLLAIGFKAAVFTLPANNPLPLSPWAGHGLVLGAPA